jgi:hypothetical protein
MAHNQSKMTDSVTATENSITRYLKQAEFVADHCFGSWEDPEWKKLADLVDADVAQYCYEAQSAVMKMLASYSVTCRPEPKDMKRFTEKVNMTNRPDGSFKAVCDLMALRISTNVERLADRASEYEDGCITAIIDQVTRAFMEKLGGTYVRINNAYGPNIVQFIYGHLPGVGIMEIQIGHPFVHYVFAADSIKRHADDNGLECDYPNFWDNNFFQNVQKYILGTNDDYDVIGNCKLLYGDKPIDSELLAILENIVCIKA